MPRLANERQELYCIARAKGAVPKKAATAAGYATGSAVYTALEADPDVELRILELTHEIQIKRTQQREAAVAAAQMVGKVTGLGRAWVLEQLAENVVAARQIDDIGNANAALKMIGDEFGMWKGASGPNGHGGQDGDNAFDVEGAHDLLQKFDDLTQLPADLAPGDTEPAEIDTEEAIQHLIQGNKPKRSAQVESESETQVALKEDDEE